MSCKVEGCKCKAAYGDIRGIPLFCRKHRLPRHIYAKRRYMAKPDNPRLNEIITWSLVTFHKNATFR